MKKIIAGMAGFAFVFALALAQDAAPAKDGKTVFTEKKCTNCHSVKSAGVESPKKDNAFDLSTVGDANKAEDLSAFLKKEAKINDKNHPMPFKGTDEELKALSTWLETLKTPKAE